MASTFWYILFSYAIYMGSLFISNAWMAANKLGTFEDPLSVWHKIVIALVFVILEGIVKAFDTSS